MKYIIPKKSSITLIEWLKSSITTFNPVLMWQWKESGGNTKASQKVGKKSDKAAEVDHVIRSISGNEFSSECVIVPEKTKGSMSSEKTAKWKSDKETMIPKDKEKKMASCPPSSPLQGKPEGANVVPK
ncbi:hypothetical protein M422DRAFT_51261 [Sphaerobolus stellatus SS14]|uniref:Uncharacterized protein n=1 Tax=Sphaerobolus stellatus (strain SS14) TaxID=990650 RepID=A0A0C9V2Q2_SPHS4|nr:hypothetical protein M422DRAFT_51261 [Sphaerobolus stellatus SS14]